MSHEQITAQLANIEKINFSELEINIIYNCNMACKGCSHLSPLLEPNAVDSTTLSLQLKKIEKLIHADTISLIGGEPLLHPNLEEIIKAIKESKISNKIRIVTNGLLINKLSDKIWTEISELYVSLYPKPVLSSQKKAQIIANANKYNISLRFAFYPSFRETFSQIECENNSVVEAVYETCEIVHQWKCYTLDNGRLYKCPQSLFIPKIKRNILDQSIDLTDPTMTLQKINLFLKEDVALDACKHCLGSSGKLFPHKLINRDEEVCPEKDYCDLVDFNFLLDKSENKPSAMSRYRIIELFEKRR